jgi:hypothetical protein
MRITPCSACKTFATGVSTMNLRIQAKAFIQSPQHQQALAADEPYRTDNHAASAEYQALQLSLRGADVDEFVVADAEWLWQTLCQLLQFVVLVALAVLALALASAVSDTTNPGRGAAAVYVSAWAHGNQDPGRKDAYAGP